jgi:hypothetical protein
VATPTACARCLAQALTLRRRPATAKRRLCLQLRRGLDCVRLLREHAVQPRPPGNAAPQVKEALCVVCLNLPAPATLYHRSARTGHQCCCVDCAAIIEARGEGCPVCREPVDEVIRVFT